MKGRFVTMTAVRMLCVVALMSGCRFPTGENDPAMVMNLRFSPSAFDSFTSNTRILYSLKYPARVSIAVVRRTGGVPDELVKTIASDLYESKGTHSHAWLGDTNGGLFAPAGEYRGIVSVGGQEFEAQVRVFHF